MMLVTLNLLAATVVLLSSVLALNSMSRNTCHFIRAAYVLLAVGSFYILIGPLYGYSQARASQVVLNVGIAVLLSANKREAYLVALYTLICRVIDKCKRNSSPV